MTNTAPAIQLSTKRGLLKFILLSAITFGIYGIVVFTKISSEINIVASQHDGKKTMNFLLMALIFTPITAGIASIVWTHRICNRIGNELKVRGINYSFGAGTFWGWGVLGSFIGIGPFVFMHKFFKGMNLINAHYNVNG